MNRGATIFVVLFLCFVWSGDGLAETQQEPAKLVFGVVPQQPATKLALHWTPVLQWLSRQTGIQIEFATAQDIPTFEHRLAAGQYDIAFMNPYHYTVFHETTGYRAFAREKQIGLRGIVVVRKDSKYTDVAQLAGETLAFPSPAAFAASIVTQAELRQQRVPFTPEYVASHDSVYRAVAMGIFPAGGGVERTLNNMEPAVRAQLRVLWQTKAYTSHALAAHPRVPSQMVTRLQESLLKMEFDAEGASLLQALDLKGIVRVSDKDYQDNRDLNIHVLDQLVKY